MKQKKIIPEDLLGSCDLKMDIKKSEPACMWCLPPTSLNDHAVLYGVPLHSRIDCPPNQIIGLSEKALENSLEDQQ